MKSPVADLNQLWPQQPGPASGQSWWKNCVIYQIYPRSFQDSDGDGVGDLQGIVDRMGYLEALGIDAIWLSPIYPSPMADFGYDVTDHCDIDPLFGSLETFDRLLAAAHARGIKVILDYVGNHTSHEHPWFVESRSSRDNPKRAWYIWRDARNGGGPPNNWLSFFGGSAWTWDERTKQYYLHLFLREQPDLNWRNPEVVQAMHAVLRFWLGRGVDGFRMDAVTMMVKHAELPDMAEAKGLHGIDLLQKHVYVHNQPELHDVLRELRDLFDDYPGDRVMIGETGDLNPHTLASFYGRDLDELHLPFNFIAMHTPWQAAPMKQAIVDYYRALPPGATPNFVFGNHDISRPATRYGRENHRSVGMLLLTLAGVATLYYGDELGMEDGQIPVDRVQDPVAARGVGLEVPGRDPARTPMPWGAGANAGFTTADEPWLPLADGYETANVARQAADPGSTLNLYRKLIALRQATPALRYGSLALVDDVPETVLAYRRRDGDDCWIILINFAGEEAVVDIADVAAQVVLHVSTAFTEIASPDVRQIPLKPHESLLLRVV